MALSKTFIRGSRIPGKHRDDDNLYLDIPPSRLLGGSWVFRYTLGGKAKTIDLGGRSRDVDEVRGQKQRGAATGWSAASTLVTDWQRTSARGR